MRTPVRVRVWIGLQSLLCLGSLVLSWFGIGVMWERFRWSCCPSCVSTIYQRGVFADWVTQPDAYWLFVQTQTSVSLGISARGVVRWHLLKSAFWRSLK